MKENKYGLYPEWSIRGKTFSPEALKKMYPDLWIKAPKEKGDLETRGRNRGEEIEEGSCWVAVKDHIEYKLEWLLEFILSNQKNIKALGVEEETIWIMWYGNQGNMEFSPEVLKRLSETGNQLNMIYYHVEYEDSCA